MINTIIIAGFPGSGKTYLRDKMTKENPGIKVLDISSKSFKRILTDNGAELKTSRYPKNYISYIKRVIGIFDVILIDSSPQIQRELNDSHIEYSLVIPSLSMTVEEYIKRYKNGKFYGRTKFFTSTLIPDWHTVLHNVSDINPHIRKFYLTKENPYLTDVINSII